MVGSTIELKLDVLRPQASQLGTGSWEDNWHLNPDNIYATEIFRLEIIGLFEFPIEEENEPLDASANDQKMQLLNVIFTTNNVAEAIQNFQMHNFVSAWEEALAEIDTTIKDFLGGEFSLETSFESVIELYDAREVDAFRAEAYQLLPDYWLITDLSNSFEAISSSMDTLQEIGQWTLLISAGATIMILNLLVTLDLRDRRSEIGIYVALGEKKFKTISQLLIEIMIPAIIGMALAVFIGSSLSENISRSMIQNQLLTENSSNSSFSNSNLLDRFGFNQEMSVDDMIESFEITLDLETLGLFFGTGIVVVTLSIIIPVIYIINLNPKEILLKN